MTLTPIQVDKVCTDLQTAVGSGKDQVVAYLEKEYKEDLKEVFGTTDISQVAIEIVKRGEIHLTTEQSMIPFNDR